MRLTQPITLKTVRLHPIACFCIIAVVLLAHDAPQAVAQVVEKGLVSYWSFDKTDVEGKVVKDSWGQNDGVFFGAPKQVPGKVGEAFRFNGPDDAIDVASPADGSLDFGDDKDFSMMAWIKLSTEPALDGGQSTIISKGDGGNNARILWKIKGKLVLVTLANEIAGGPKPDFTSKKEVVDGKWHHVVLIGERSKSTRIYIDGILDVEGPASKGCDVTTESPLFIGASVRVGKKTRRHFLGLIDEVGIYNRVLSLAEIKRNMAAQGLTVRLLGKLAATWANIKLDY